MKYHVALFDFHFAEEWQQDVFLQALFDLGFDSIEENKAYIPSDILEENRTAIESLCANEPCVSLLSLTPCPDENWNAVWESEHPMQELPLGVKIIPHCAFGAGHHETTSMMIEALMQHTPTANVLDHGTGTGVLAIYAKRLGATHVIAVDIDEKSVLNARENAALNNVDIEVYQSATLDTLLSTLNDSFSLILANIHRNVLLQFMPFYALHLVPNGQVWLSGFYASDCPALIDAAQAEGLTLLNTRSNAEWCMLQFGKVEH